MKCSKCGGELREELKYHKPTGKVFCVRDGFTRSIEPSIAEKLLWLAKNYEIETRVKASPQIAVVVWENNLRPFRGDKVFYAETIEEAIDAAYKWAKEQKGERD
jgi:hypothetical protein